MHKIEKFTQHNFIYIKQSSQADLQNVYKGMPRILNFIFSYSEFFLANMYYF